MSNNRLVVAVTLVTAIIGTILGVAGYFRVEPVEATNVFITLSGGETPTPLVVQSTVIISPTPMPRATLPPPPEPITVEVTSIVEVTRLVESPVTRVVEATRVVTATPSPLPTGTATPEFTPLAVGETWVFGDRSLKLQGCTLSSAYPGSRDYNAILCVFEFNNIASDLIIFDTDTSNFKLETNTGLSITPPDLYPVEQFQVARNDIVTIGKSRYTDEKGVPFLLNYYDESITEVRITAINVGGVPNAQWQMTIPH